MAVQGGSWSKLGSLADSVPPEQHTMILNLKDCVDDDRKEATILHEFGHALGLGHEHQHPKYVTVMEKFIDIDATMDCYGIEKPSFYREQYGKLNVKLVKTEYDPDSIMHYPYVRETILFFIRWSVVKCMYGVSNTGRYMSGLCSNTFLVEAKCVPLHTYYQLCKTECILLF